MNLPIDQINRLGISGSGFWCFDLSHRQIKAISPKLQLSIEGIKGIIPELDLSYNRITKVCNIPRNVEILDLSGNYIESIHNVPDRIRKIRLSDNVSRSPLVTLRTYEIKWQSNFHKKIYPILLTIIIENIAIIIESYLIFESFLLVRHF